MTLLSEIQSDLKQAMLDKDELTRDTLRMFKSEVQKFEIDSKETADDAKVLQIINKMIKPTSSEPLIAPGFDTLNFIDSTPYSSLTNDAMPSASVS